MYDLKSLNVCELVAGLFSTHYNIISDSSHSTVGYFAGPSFWFRAPNKVKNTYHCSTQRFKLFTFVNLQCNANVYSPLKLYCENIANPVE